MYIADLQIYEFKISFKLPQVRTVGWLDEDHSFNKGNVPANFIDKLWQVIETRAPDFDLNVNVVRGIHPCNFCGEDIFRRQPNGKRTMLGISELWIPHQDGWFAAPSLIVHYVERYQYRPPNAFIDSVLDIRLDHRHIAQEAFDSMYRSNAIKSTFAEIAALLSQHGELNWRKAFLKFNQEYDSSPNDVERQVLASYGGMGSFNDLVLQENGIALRYENDRLDDLRHKLFNLCKN